MRSTLDAGLAALRTSAQSAPSTARSRSASAKTSIGSLPPSSSDDRAAAARPPRRRRVRPTATEPVKKTFAIPGRATSASPTSRLALHDRTSPAGAPASSKTRATHSPVSGVSSDGLSTTALPAATAVATCVNGIANGMFHGVIAATTPSGS